MDFWLILSYYRDDKYKYKTIAFMKNIFKLLSVLTMISLLCVACEENKQPIEGPEEQPTLPIATVELGELTRTSVSFTIKSDSPGDYVWKIVPSSETISDSEALFGSGKTGMFNSSNSIDITYNELEGGKEYSLYVAVRKINPYIYSELVVEEIVTAKAYTEMITLEKATTNAISYHIEKPADAPAYRHMILDYNDFLYFQALVGVTHSSYLSSFGLGADRSQTFKYEWKQMDGWDNYPTNFYSDTKYLILAGKSAGVSLEDGVSEEDVKVLEFTTPKAEVCPYDVAVTVSDLTSLAAKVTLAPEEGIDRYRALILSEADYEAFLFEGEEMVRRAVIGNWDDYSNEYKDKIELTANGLIPDSRYYVCIMAFDEDMRELYIEETFTTSEPSGPKPEVTVEAREVETPWCSAAVNLKVKNAVSGVMMIRTRYVVDNVLNAPGNEDVTMEDIIRNNGDPIAGAILDKALSDDGADLAFEDLSPNTDYVFGIMMTNQERISEYHVYEFRTGAEPVVETTLFDKLKGNYTARITDLGGVQHTFDVTIADGVNDATREAYAAENILVCLGFDPCGVKYHSPQDLLDKNWASTEEEANRNYGPKWFLEIDQDEKITTYKHGISSSYWDDVNQTVIIDYTAEGEAPMASFDGKTIWFKGTFWRDFSSPDREDIAMATTLIHDVDFDEATGVITVLPVTHYKGWSAKGQMITEYPGVEMGRTWFGAANEVIFCGNSALVLTPKQGPSRLAVSLKPGKELKAPLMRQVNVYADRPIIQRGR